MSERLIHSMGACHAKYCPPLRHNGIRSSISVHCYIEGVIRIWCSVRREICTSTLLEGIMEIDVKNISLATLNNAT